MKNISSIKSCYGCGVCAVICPKQIITLQLNQEGFYEPGITDEQKCIECGLCLAVCSFNDEQLASQPQFIKSYSAWSNDKYVRQQCSSGGIGFEIGQKLIAQGYKACGVRYNPDEHRAEHYIATTIQEFTSSIGSKYIQSYTVDGFNAINKEDKFLITGTPCQIDSIRRYVKKLKIEDHFILLDFFCHGVPSMYIWKNYINNIEKKLGRVNDVSWRNKHYGWQNSWAIDINNFQEKEYAYSSLMKNGDTFYKFFLQDVCLGKACYHHCKYKYDKSSADIRIGDLWGRKYQNNQEGVSAVVAFTENGNNLIQSLSNCHFKEENLDVVAEGQMKTSPKEPFIRSFLIRKLKTNYKLALLTLATYLKYKRGLYIITNIPLILKRKLCKIGNEN